jgi:L-amino acid N-acyltransferase YncA
VAKVGSLAGGAIFMSESFANRYPRTIERESTTFTIRFMTSADESVVLNFAKSLPHHDLLFLRRDISKEPVMAAWVRDIEQEKMTSLIILTSDDEVVGCSAVFNDPLSFSPHVGDLRVVLGVSHRSFGLGRELVQENFLVALDKGLEKLTAHMTADQEAAISVFQDLDFRAEALLKRHVRDKEGNYFDLVILSHDVKAVQNKMDLYGLSDALGGDD